MGYRYRIGLFQVIGDDGDTEPVEAPDGLHTELVEDPTGPFVSADYHEMVARERDELAQRLSEFGAEKKELRGLLDTALAELTWWFNTNVGPCEKKTPAEPDGCVTAEEDPDEWCNSCRAEVLADTRTALGQALEPLIDLGDESEEQIPFSGEPVITRPRHRRHPNDPDYIPRALRDGDGVLLCNECCSGNPCDDPTHWQRFAPRESGNLCPFCGGDAERPGGTKFMMYPRHLRVGDMLRSGLDWAQIRRIEKRDDGRYEVFAAHHCIELQGDMRCVVAPRRQP